MLQRAVKTGPIMSIECKIHSIFLATEGEGVFIGHPQVFVRFQGCAVGCINCDSKETWDFSKSQPLSSEDVLYKIEALSMGLYQKRVSITGGDPLHPLHELSVLFLIDLLKSRHYFINLEASGTRMVKKIFDAVDFISFDFKTLSTQVRPMEELLLKTLELYGSKMQIKSVIQTEKDFNQVHSLYEKHQKIIEAQKVSWCLTPAYNLEEQFPQERFIKIFEMNYRSGGYFRVIGQQHKWVYGPQVKDV